MYVTEQCDMSGNCLCLVQGTCRYVCIYIIDLVCCVCVCVCVIQGYHVYKIVPGSPAEQCGKIKLGDRLIEVCV